MRWGIDLCRGGQRSAVPHGHNEIVTIRLRAVASSRLDGIANMVEPFERAKTIWHRWIDNNVDHALQLSENDPLLDWFAAHEPQRLRRILVTPGDPTTEVLACCMMAKISAFLAADGGRLSCAEIRIEETPTNAVTFDGSPATFLPMPETIRSWWHRADMSINDLGAFTQDTSRCLVSAS
jgi:6-pyruvoyltetrahydropterin/6-carboxytetrahydropterin synthase